MGASPGCLARMPERGVGANRIMRTVPRSLRYAPALAQGLMCIRPACMDISEAGGCGNAPVEPDKSLSREVSTLLPGEPDGPDSGRSDNRVTDRPLEPWYCVRTDSEGHATGRDLPDHEMTGRIPAEAGKLGQPRRKNAPGSWSWSTISLPMNVLPMRTAFRPAAAAGQSARGPEGRAPPASARIEARRRAPAAGKPARVALSSGAAGSKAGTRSQSTASIGAASKKSG